MMKQKSNIKDLVKMVKDQEQSVSELDSKLYYYSEKHFQKQNEKKLKEHLKPILDTISTKLDFPVDLPSFRLKKKRYSNKSGQLTITNKIIERENKRKSTFDSIFQRSIFFLIIILSVVFFIMSFSFLLSLEPNFYLSVVLPVSFVSTICIALLLAYISVKVYNSNIEERLEEEKKYFLFFFGTQDDQPYENNLHVYNVKWFNSHYVEPFIAEIYSYISSKLTTLEDKSFQMALELKQKKNQVCTSCGSSFRDDDAFCSKCGKSRD